jgi:hypothetical protein
MVRNALSCICCITPPLHGQTSIALRSLSIKDGSRSFGIRTPSFGPKHRRCPGHRISRTTVRCDTRFGVCAPLRKLFERAATTPIVLPAKTVTVGASAGCRKTKSTRDIDRHLIPPFRAVANIRRRVFIRLSLPPDLRLQCPSRRAGCGPVPSQRGLTKVRHRLVRRICRSQSVSWDGF